jgi:hypothetical protein
MVLFTGQAGRIVLGVLALIGIRLFYKYVRIVEIVVAFLVLAQLAAYVIPRFTFNKSESDSAIFPEAASSSTFESNRSGPKRLFERSLSERRQEEIQMHLRRLEMAAVATASTSNEEDDYEPYMRPTGIPRSHGEVIHRQLSYQGSYIGLETRPSRPSRNQGEEIQRHLQRLAMAAAAADAGVANVSPSLL